MQRHDHAMDGRWRDAKELLKSPFRRARGGKVVYAWMNARYWPWVAVTGIDSEGKV
jgi:hypothetical protein